MAQAKLGDTVRVRYIGRYEDGSVFDSSDDHGKPLEFIIGRNQVIPAFESGVIGMEPDMTKTIEVPPEEGYGAYRDDLVVELKRADLPEDMELKEGSFIEWMQPDGQIGLAKLLTVTDEMIRVDTNHPMAGKKLFFDVTLQRIM